MFFAHIAAVETRDFKLFHCPHLAAICEGEGCETCPKSLSPSLCSLHVCVVVPQRPLKWLPTLATLSPQLSGDHGGIAPASGDALSLSVSTAVPYQIAIARTDDSA